MTRSESAAEASRTGTRTDRNASDPAGLDPAGLDTTRAAGWLMTLAGALFFLTVGYLFTVLTGQGLTLTMFDDAAGLLTWLSEHLGAYQGLWVLYFAVQLVLLPVPVLLARTLLRLGAAPGVTIAGAVIGCASIVLAMVGLVGQFALGVSLTPRYAAANDPAVRTALLALHDVAADTGKNLRLFSELMFGIWFAAAGLAWARLSRSRAALVAVAVGGWTILVAAWKIIDPYVGLEDWLAFVIGAGQIAWGCHLVRRASSGSGGHRLRP